LVQLPGDRGYAEVKSEPTDPGAARGARAPNVVLVAYFYAKDGTTQMEPPPTDVSIKAGTSDNSPIVALSPSTDPAAPKGRFLSQPAPIREGFQGDVRAKVNGEAVQASFTLR
jgi:hypothetical protein